MASTIKASFQDVAEVRRDLESVELGLGRALTAALREEASPLAQLTAQLTPRGPGPQSEKDNLPHVAETIRGGATATGIAIVSTHPAAGWLNWGGTISPHRNQRITIRGYGMGQKAAEQRLPQIEQAITRRIDGLLRQHGL